MADLIERSEIVKVAEHAYHEWELAMVGAETNRQVNKTYKMQELCKAVKAVAEAAPAVDAKLVVHSAWHQTDYHDFHCLECGELVHKPTKFCPNCGAQMDGRRKLDGRSY